MRVGRGTGGQLTVCLCVASYVPQVAPWPRCQRTIVFLAKKETVTGGGKPLAQGCPEEESRVQVCPSDSVLPSAPRPPQLQFTRCRFTMLTDAHTHKRAYVCMHTHKCMHTHEHVCTCVYTQYMHTRTCVCAHTRTHSTHICEHVCTTCVHTHTQYTHTCAYACTHTHTHGTHKCMRVYPHTQTDMHTCTCVHTQVHRHMHTNIHVRTHA